MTTYFETTELSRRFFRADVGKRHKQKRAGAFRLIASGASSLAYLDSGSIELNHVFPVAEIVSWDNTVFLEEAKILGNFFRSSRGHSALFAWQRNYCKVC